MTKEQKMISQIIQDTLDYAYCDNCRYNKEIRPKTEEDDNPCRIFRERTRIEINYCSKTFFNFYYGLKVVRDEM